MFTFISAQVIAKGNSGGWQKKNLNYTRMDFINRDHVSCILEIQNADTLDIGYVNFFDFPVTDRLQPIPLNEYLLRNDDIIISVIKEKFEPSDNVVRCYLGAGMGLSTRGSNRNLSTEDDLLPDQQIDLLIEHPEMNASDYERFNKHSLITVAGLIHFTDARENGLIVYDGAHTAWGYGEDRVGILDFYGVGSVRKKRISPDMLRYPLGKEVMHQILYVDVGESLNNRTVFLSLAGVFYPIEQFVQIVDDSVIKINLHEINLIDLYYETRHLLDYSEFPLRRDPFIDDLIVTEDFSSEEFILALLTMSQSFLCIMEGNNITVERRPIHNHHVPTQYSSTALRDVDLPIIIGRGYLPGYNYNKMIDFNLYSIPNFLFKHPLRRTAVEPASQRVRDINYGYRDHSYANASHLLIKRVFDD